MVIDGMMRLRAVRAIRKKQPERFQSVAVYVFDYERRFEIRYQSDIYQDLLPSQLAVLVEHLHKAEHIRKIDIARYIGVSPPTLRNYTGLWRLLQRGGLFAKIVDLMDVEVIPSSNPYAWLRLTAAGLRKVIEDNFSEGESAETWIEQTVKRARQGDKQRFPIKLVETITDALPPEYYRVGEEVRSVKRDLGQRKGGSPTRSGRHDQALSRPTSGTSAADASQQARPRGSDRSQPATSGSAAPKATDRLQRRGHASQQARPRAARRRSGARTQTTDRLQTTRSRISATFRSGRPILSCALRRSRFRSTCNDSNRLVRTCVFRHPGTGLG